MEITTNKKSIKSVPELVEGKQGYKKTKIGWIPEDWELVSLEEFTSEKGLIRGPFGGALKKEFFKQSGYKVYEQKNAIYNNFEIGSYFVDEIKFDELKRFEIKTGDLIVSCSGTIGKIAEVPPNVIPGLINQALLILRISKTKSISYFKQYFIWEAFQSKIIDSTQGGAMKNMVGMSEFRKIRMACPPLLEQQKIAEILSTWDKAIEQSQNLIQQLKSRKKGLMQQLLTCKTRLKGFSGERKVVKLSEITDRITKKNEELNDNVVTISAQRGFVRQEDFFKKRVASDTLSGYYLIEKGNFAYNKSYSNGYPMGAFKRLDNFDKAVVTTLYICFSIKDNVDSDFMVNFFEGSLMVNNLMKIAQEGGRAHGLLNISLGDFFSLKLNIPSIEEQIAIAKVLTTADNEIKAQESYLLQLQAQKKGLMQQLLTGQKRVKLES